MRSFLVQSFIALVHSNLWRMYSTSFPAQTEQSKSYILYEITDKLPVLVIFVEFLCALSSILTYAKSVCRGCRTCRVLYY